jgi:hypothetical protein
MPLAVVIEGLSEILAQAPKDDELQISPEFFNRMGAPDSETKAPLPEQLRQTFRPTSRPPFQVC